MSPNVTKTHKTSQDTKIWPSRTPSSWAHCSSSTRTAGCCNLLSTLFLTATHQAVIFHFMEITWFGATLNQTEIPQQSDFQFVFHWDAHLCFPRETLELLIAGSRDLRGCKGYNKVIFIDLHLPCFWSVFGNCILCQRLKRRNFIQFLVLVISLIPSFPLFSPFGVGSGLSYRSSETE